MPTASAARMLGRTESLCPVCLGRVPATKVSVGDDVYLEKHCPAHGFSRTIIWRGPPSYTTWEGPPHPPAPPLRPSTRARSGCPFDCGLCPEHRQRTCCVLLEVTSRCNLRCPICFAGASSQGCDPDLDELERSFRLLSAQGGRCNVQLSGGEPTVRDDLPEVIALGRRLGHDFIQLNTNGIRLAREPGYAKRLKDAGLGCVFLQFDGVSDAVHRRIRGAALAQVKAAAIACCAEVGLGVVLVPTLVANVNTEELGAIIAFALEQGPAVRGVHFQPVSYFGRYPRPPEDRDRFTLPEVMMGLERQTQGMVLASHLRPPGAENAHCSFSGNFVRTKDGLAPTLGGQTSCCGTPELSAQASRATCCPGKEAEAARQVVALRWSLPGGAAKPEPDGSGVRVDSLDAFLAQGRRASFSISGMAFQDVWNIDLERVRECFIHVVAPGSRLVPFCAYNVTDVLGRSLYRPRLPVEPVRALGVA